MSVDYWMVVAPVGIVGLAAVVLLARMLAPHHGARVARYQPEPEPERQGYDVAQATAPTVVQASGAPPWDEARLRAILAAEVDGIEPAPMPQYAAAPVPRGFEVTEHAAEPWQGWEALKLAELEPEPLEPEPDEMERRLRENDRAELGIAPLPAPTLPPHLAAMAAAVREQHARSCPTCLVEQRPWYDPSWIDAQLGLLYSWVRRVHRSGML